MNEPELPLSCLADYSHHTLKTVKISNVSLSASQWDINEFFSFYGDIDYIEMQSESENSQLAFVTFKDSEGVYTAERLTGAIIIDRTVSISPAENYQLPPNIYKQNLDQRSSFTDGMVEKTEDVVSNMLAKSVVIGKNVINKAKTFDEQHHLSSSASVKLSSLDHRFRLTEKINSGTAIVGGKAREMDGQFQVSEMAKSAFAAAEQKATRASIVHMRNSYVSTGASWFSNALNMVVKTNEDVWDMTKEKIKKTEEERRDMVSEDAKLHFEPPNAKVGMEGEKL